MRHYSIIFLCGVISIGSATADEIKGKVTRVRDGDTIEIETIPPQLLVYDPGLVVRLKNIDAPEYKQPFGRWSKDVLSSMVAGEFVTVTYSESDKYGRILGVVSTSKSHDVSRDMVAKGAAWTYEQYNDNPELVALERTARTKREGLWAVSNPIPPWEWRTLQKNKQSRIEPH